MSEQRKTVLPVKPPEIVVATTSFGVILSQEDWNKVGQYQADLERMLEICRDNPRAEDEERIADLEMRPTPTKQQVIDALWGAGFSEDGKSRAPYASHQKAADAMLKLFGDMS